jgi:acyl carrier protein
MSEFLLEEVRDRVTGVIAAEFGKLDEDLVGSGLIDSLKAIDVALLLEEKFGVSLHDISVADMRTVTSLSKKIFTIIAREKESSWPAEPDSR